MIIKTADGTILESHNKLVIEQWVKAGYEEYDPNPVEKAVPEEKPKRSRKKSAEE